MAFSVSPAVTVQEVDATSSVIATSTTPGAIVGVFRWGPVNERVLVTTEEELAQRFGRPANYPVGLNQTWNNTETFFTAADFLAYSNALYVTRVMSNANTEMFEASSANFAAKYPGTLPNGAMISFVKEPEDFELALFDETPILNVDEIVYNTDTFVIESLDDYTTELNVNDVLNVGRPDLGYQNLYIQSVNVTSATDPLSNTEVFTHAITFKNRYNLSELDYGNLDYKRVWGYSNVLPVAPTEDHMHVVVIDKTGAISGTPETILEVFENLSTIPGETLADGTNNYWVEALENRSAWIKANPTSSLDSAPSSTGYELLSGGSDGSDERSIGFGRLAQGWDLYKEANEVDVGFLIQGKANGSSNLANYIVQNIAEYRKDCVAYLSPRFEDVVAPSNAQIKLTNILAYRNTVQSSSYWFMDSGYKYRYDKYNDTYRWVPLNGDIAGLSAQIQPWESPAGYKRGVIKNLVKLAFNPNKAQRDQLFVKDINPVMTQVGFGTILFGDKTGLGYGSAFNRINVRRLFITVEKAIATAAAQFLFDFNDEFTQTAFKNMVEPYLRDIQGQRGIIDFAVVSDTRVNTPDVVDMNIFRGNIYIKPARTITEIQLKFVATRTATEFEEIIGQTT